MNVIVTPLLFFGKDLAGNTTKLKSPKHSSNIHISFMGRSNRPDMIGPSEINMKGFVLCKIY